MAVGSEDRGPEIGSLCPHGGIPAWPLCGSGQGSGWVSLLFQPPAKLLSFTTLPDFSSGLALAMGSWAETAASCFQGSKCEGPVARRRRASSLWGQELLRATESKSSSLLWCVSGQSDLSHRGCAVRAHFGSLNNWVEAGIPWCSASRWLQA